MGETLLIYLLLKILMLVSAVVCGHMCLKHKRLIPFVLPFVLFFAINEGLRFGRGIDYNGYYFKYNDILKFGFEEPKEFLFVIYCKIIDYLGLNYQGFICSLSIVLIVSCIYSLRKFKSILPFALPLFCLYSIGAENLIRWWFSFSFLMIGVSFAVEKQYKNAIIFAVISCLLHTAMLVVIIIMAFIYFFAKKAFTNVLFLWGIYMLIYGFFKPENMAQVVPYLNILQFGDSSQFAGYVQNADRWLTGTANYIGGELSIIMAIQDLLVIYIATYVVKNHSRTLFYYYLCLFGTLLYPAFFQIEILWRIIDVFHLYQYVIIAYAMHDILVQNTKKKDIKITICCILVALNLVRVHIINYFFSYDENSILFIWDAAGRNYLNII